MTPQAREVLDFIRRAQLRRMLLGVVTHAAVGIAALVAIGMIGRLLTRNPRGAQAEAILFGLTGGIVFAIAGAVRAWRRRAGTPLEIERRAPESRNIIITAAELSSSSRAPLSFRAQRTSSPDVAEFVVARAATTVRSLDASRIFPARHALVRLGVALVFWAATIGLAAGRDPEAPITLGASPKPDEVGTIQITVTPPAYTGRKVQRLSNPSRIEAIAGSRIAVDVRGSDIRIETADGPLAPSRPSANSPSFIAQADGFIAVQAGKSARRLIGLTVTPDQVPRVRITAPAKDMFLPDAKRRIPVSIEARDDIALTTLELRYTKVSGSGERFTFVEGRIPVAVTRANPNDWRASGTLDLGVLSLEQGDMVVYRGAAADGRPGAQPAESDAFIVEIVSPLSAGAAGFTVDDEQDKYALSQQMVILKTERLLARAATMSPDSLAYYSQNIAAEQRSVRAEFVFMMGGEVAEEVIAAANADIDETREAENESELAAGRMVNRGRLALVDAIRRMSRASANLNNVDPKAALPEEKAALASLQEAFSRTRYLLRALTQRERLDLSRRLTGVLTLAARDAQPQASPAADPAVVALRRSLADIAALASTPTDHAAASRVAQQVLAVDPSDTTLQRVASRLGDSRIDEAATALALALRARLPREDAAGESPELRRLRGALSDCLKTSSRVRGTCP